MENALQLQVIAESLHNRLQRGAIPVPVLPPLAERVVRLLQTPGVTSSQFVELLRQDEHTTLRVLRAASTPLFCRTGNLLTLPQATQNLGLQSLGDLVLAASLTTDLFYAPGYRHCILEQLQASIMCALWSREIAKLRRRGLAAAFRTGLLWNIGRPLAIQEVLECAMRHRLHLNYDYVLALADQFGEHLTQRVLHHWQMPTVIGEVAASFTAYDYAGMARDQTIITVAGARLTEYCKHGKNRAASIKKLLVDPVFTALRLPPQTLTELLQRTDLIAQTADHLLGI